jgi:RNA polymerase sigma factor (TIGR02999 family)
MVSTVQPLDAAADDASSNAPQLFQSLYAELHRLAQSQLRRGPAVSISATVLVHEVYLDLSAREPIRYPDRVRFMAYAARAMRGLVIDYARQRRAQKRGGAFHLTSLDTAIADGTPDAEELAGIGDALESLAKIDPPLAELVDLRYFAGFSVGEIAVLRGVSERTVQRDWLKARLYLRRALLDSAM